jgi:hypothetical protein
MEDDLFNDKPLLDLSPIRKTKKNAKKSNLRISRKAIMRVEEDLKAEYRKYVNSIKRRKLCKVKSFRVFANERMGKKTRRNVKKNSVKSAESAQPIQSFFSAPSSAPVEQVSAPEESKPVEPLSVPEEIKTETPTSNPVEETKPAEEETKPAAAEEGNSIVKSITDTLGLSSSTKTGGKKSKRKNHRSRK